MTEPRVAAAYDSIAQAYDQAMAGDAWMRQRLWTTYLRAFRAGDHVLDLACGTGIDALYLADHNIRVTGIDISPGMIGQLRAKVAVAGVEDRVIALVGDSGDLSDFPNGSFDGAISAFAGLNTVADLCELAEQLARVLRPRGRAIFHVLNRFSLWEWLGLVVAGRWGDALRLGAANQRAFVIGGQTVQHALYDPSDAYNRVFARQFRLRGTYALGVLRPPHTVQRVPPLGVLALGRLERFAGRRYPFVRLGRFFVLELERRE